jgi:hypothetical protein
MNENRETANAETYPAILRLAGDIAPFDDAQGRLRQGGTFSVFFTKKIHVVNFFVKKKKEYHAAAGESDFYRVNRLV